MKIAAPQRTRDDDANLIPLINVVFLLIIFFMLAGTFARPDHFEVSPPQSLSNSVPDEPTLVVLVSATGRLAIGDQVLDEQQLQARVSARLRGEPELHILLKADERLPAEKLIDIMDLLREAGLKKLTLLTMLEKM